MNGIYVKISGDPAALHDLADWLENKPSKLSDELHQSLKKLKNDSTWSWLGETGNTFRETVGAIEKGVDPVDAYSKDAATAFRAFAERLKRGREKFQDFADKAKSGRLVVNGDWITMPLQPPPPPPGAYPYGQSAPVTSMVNGACVDTWEPGEYQVALDLFNELSEDVGTWWSDLEDWIDEKFVPLINRVTDFDELAWVVDTLGKGNDLARGTAVNVINAAWAERMRYFEDTAAKARERADTYTKRRNSGKPSTKSTTQGESKKDLNNARNAFDKEVKKLRIGSRMLPVVGFAIDVVAAGIDVENGGSISSNAVGIGATAGSGAVLGTTATAFGLTGGGWVIVIGGLAYLVGLGATAFYEGQVPLDIREALDAGDWEYVF